MHSTSFTQPFTLHLLFVAPFGHLSCSLLVRMGTTPGSCRGEPGEPQAASFDFSYHPGHVWLYMLYA